MCTKGSEKNWRLEKYMIMDLKRIWTMDIYLEEFHQANYFLHREVVWGKKYKKIAKGLIAKNFSCVFGIRGTNLSLNRKIIDRVRICTSMRERKIITDFCSHIPPSSNPGYAVPLKHFMDKIYSCQVGLIEREREREKKLKSRYPLRIWRTSFKTVNFRHKIFMYFWCSSQI